MNVDHKIHKAKCCSKEYDAGQCKKGPEYCRISRFLVVLDVHYQGIFKHSKSYIAVVIWLENVQLILYPLIKRFDSDSTALFIN